MRHRHSASVDLGHDVRFAARSLRRARWYAISVICVVGFSMALAATVFAVVDGFLFRPLPYRHPDEIVVVSGAFDNERRSPEQRLGRLVSPHEARAWAAFVPDIPLTVLNAAVNALPDGTNAPSMSIDERFGDIFGVRLLMGRWFDRADYTHPPSQPPVPTPIIISHALWQEQFGGDPSIVGRTYSPYTTAADPGWLPAPVFRVVGVLDPDGFVPPQPGASDWLWRDSRVDVLRPREADIEHERAGVAYARIPRDRLAATEAALQSAVAASRSTVRAINGPFDAVVVEPLATILTRRQRPILSLVFATALGLTLIVLLNTAALAVARSQRRLAEFVLRRSLGARTSHLLRSALVEQGLLTAAGVALGLTVAPWLVTIVALQLPPGLKVIEDPRADWRAVTFAVAVSTTMAIAIAALSTRYAARHAALGSALASHHGRSLGQARVGRWLVAGQIAVAFALVLGGGMFVTSLALVWQEDPGLRARDAAMLTVSLGELALVDRENDIAAALRLMPGVRAAGAMDGAILANNPRASTSFRDPRGGRPERPYPTVLRVGPGWFTASGIHLLQGRRPTDAELEGGAHVIAVSEALARRYWPDGDALGQSLVAEQQAYSVVGIVRDVRVAALDVPSSGMIIAPLRVARSRRTHAATVFLALDGSTPPTVTDVAAVLARAAPLARVREFQRIEDALAESIRPRRISALTASTFAIGAIVLVAIGVFGVVAQTAGWRTREMGIRLALGDVPAGIVRRVLVEPIGAVVVGLAAGAAGAALAARAAGSYLYGIEPYDFRVWAATIAVLLATAALAAAVPAVKAGRVDPIAVLRQD